MSKAQRFRKKMKQNNKTRDRSHFQGGSNPGRNKGMDNITYQERSKVMGYVYEAKNLLGSKFERVDIRITERPKHGILGSALLNDHIIWIPETVISSLFLREIVFHELVHALFGFMHDEKCPLMSSNIGKEPLTYEIQNCLLIKYSGKLEKGL